MASFLSATPLLLLQSNFPNSKSSASINHFSPIQMPSSKTKTNTNFFHAHSTVKGNKRLPEFTTRAEKEYKFPDPIPEFADEETEKFKTHLNKKLAKKEMFGDSVDEVVGICTEIFNDFLHSEYGGPGTLLVVPFIDMADTLNERGLPGGPQAAIKWAQDHVDKDWKEWNYR